MAKLAVKTVRLLRVSGVKKAAQRLKSNKKNIVDKIRGVVKKMIDLPNGIPESNFSVHISSTLKYDYTYLSNIFCSETGTTIQQFVITLKIDRVKKLLFLDQLSLTEISRMLHYSSVAHLSNQFRKITGVSPSSYKKLKKR
jgi:AraC-like DNA-binding protein